MTAISDQYIRRVGLLIGSPLVQGGAAVDFSSASTPINGTRLDLSQFRVKFKTYNYDGEAPDHASIKVYNLSRSEINSIISNANYSSVVLAAGYQSGNYGTIFSGDIRQFKVGKEDAVTTYLEILASDADLFYNRGLFSGSFSAGTNPIDQLNAMVNDYNNNEINLAVAPGEPTPAKLSVDSSAVFTQGLYNTTNIRGKVWVGMARSSLRNLAANLNISWHIQDGKIVLTDYQGYKEGTAVRLTPKTGLVGVPEQTDSGINCRCLLNPKVRIGGLVQLDDEFINQTKYSINNTPPAFGSPANPDPGQGTGVPYNKNQGIQNLVPISGKGWYRSYVVEHSGDTRGNEFYTDMVLLAVNIDKPVQMAGPNI